MSSEWREYLFEIKTHKIKEILAISAGILIKLHLIKEKTNDQKIFSLNGHNNLVDETKKYNCYKDLLGKSKQTFLYSFEFINR